MQLKSRHGLETRQSESPSAGEAEDAGCPTSRLIMQGGCSVKKCSANVLSKSMHNLYASIYLMLNNIKITSH